MFLKTRVQNFLCLTLLFTSGAHAESIYLPSALLKGVVEQITAHPEALQRPANVTTVLSTQGLGRDHTESSTYGPAIQVLSKFGGGRPELVKAVLLGFPFEMFPKLGNVYGVPYAFTDAQLSEIARAIFAHDRERYSLRFRLTIERHLGPIEVENGDRAGTLYASDDPEGFRRLQFSRLKAVRHPLHGDRYTDVEIVLHLLVDTDEVRLDETRLWGRQRDAYSQLLRMNRLERFQTNEARGDRGLASRILREMTNPETQQLLFEYTALTTKTPLTEVLPKDRIVSEALSLGDTREEKIEIAFVLAHSAAQALRPWFALLPGRPITNEEGVFTHQEMEMRVVGLADHITPEVMRTYYSYIWAIQRAAADLDFVRGMVVAPLVGATVDDQLRSRKMSVELVRDLEFLRKAATALSNGLRDSEDRARGIIGR